MLDWQKRVIEERILLEAAHVKLCDFIDGLGPLSILTEERALLEEQRDVMAHYYRILTQRIARFT